MSKSSSWVLVVMMIALLIPAVDCAAAPADGPAQPVILIPPFELASGRSPRFMPVNANDDARGVLEDILVNKKLKVVERQRVDSVLKEAEFSSKSTMADQEKAVKMGKMLGANVLAMGTVLNVSSETTQANAYGVRTRKTTVKASVRIRVVDITSGEITFSRVCNAQQSYDSGDKAEKSDKSVEISFEPTPGKCDVLIDGEYRGTTPLKLKLPTNKSVKVTIRKAGFEPWEATMTPSDSMKKVNPELGATAGK